MRRRLLTTALLTALGVAVISANLEAPPVLLLGLSLGLVLVFLSSDPLVEGFRGFSEYTGLSEYVAGTVSSLASNLPEAVLAVFMAFSPHLREVAVLSVMLASASNGLLLGVMVIMLTSRRGSIVVPREALERGAEVMRITISFSAIIFGTGLILNVFHGDPRLPREVSLFLLLAYASYLYFVSRAPRRRHVDVDEGGGRMWMLLILVGVAGILVSAELISGASEYLVGELDLHVVVAATLVAFAGSVPENGLALVGAHRGHVEMGVSNLVSGIVQNIMLVFPLLALMVPVSLDGYVLYQFLAIASTLWIVKKAIVDDGKLTLDEGVSIFMAHLLGILILDKLSWLI